ncbi:MAG: hypothetical protein HY674_16345 [Chloroflexi bacterium]|nr:hypothetical protein [Chloroflexota bacterium]
MKDYLIGTDWDGNRAALEQAGKTILDKLAKDTLFGIKPADLASLKGRRFGEDRPAICSAVSTNAVEYVFEPGARFGIEGRPVIDCAVVLHRGVFHLCAPDNGAGPPLGAPGADRRRPENRPREGAGYQATNADGVSFRRVDDVRIEGRRRWLGNAQSDGARSPSLAPVSRGIGWP